MASLLRNLLICVVGLTASQALAAQAASSECRDPIVLDSGPFVLDHKTNLINVQNPKITQCKTVITADEATATGLDFDTRSEWRFKGHVRVVTDTAELTADAAIFTFVDKKLSRGQLLGSATFVDKQTNDKGSANKLVYDDKAKTLLLSDNAQVHKAQYEIHGGCDLVYDLNEKRVTSGATTCPEPNRFIVVPNEKPHQDGEAPAAAPAQ
ncbi:MAG TPA: LptA/OstA family protein [Gammaproteobacteria bacterium]|nr:LptA/OstA family protein [Gammaproteobacteria bacterium]